MITFKQLRYRCEWCRKSSDSKAGMVAHEHRCRNNPDARGCSTCANDGGYGSSCKIGVDRGGKKLVVECAKWSFDPGLDIHVEEVVGRSQRENGTIWRQPPQVPA